METQSSDSIQMKDQSDLCGADADSNQGFLFSRRLRGWQWVLFFLIACLAFELRFFRVGEVPAGLYCDEAGLGYNAFALANYGVDENGVKWPLFSWSFVSYKNPMFIYAAMIPIKILGLSETSLRLTSVLFGVFTVIGLFWLLNELWGSVAALVGSFMLAITPWHIHMSRIAFELITFPCIFIIGVAFLIRAIRSGGINWPAAMLFLGLTPYCYAIANVFVPCFLLGVFILFLKDIWRFKLSFFAGIIVLLITVAPFVHFNMTKPKTDQYFKRNSWVVSDKTLQEKAQIFLKNYQAYYSEKFLFQHGDPLIRHAVPGHGELYWSFLPMLLAGIGFMSWTPTRYRLLILWWLLIFPIGAALMHEEMSATRSFIGSPLPAILGAFACVTVFSWIARIKWRWLAGLLGGICVITGLYFVVADAIEYQKQYFNQYYKQSARGIYGFQYGYREVYAYLDANKDVYPQRFLTATDVNMPYIFALFYTHKDPNQWVNGRNTGFQEFKPDEFHRYTIEKPTLFAIRPNEANYFEDYEVKKEIVGPDGITEFIIVDVKKRKQFLTDWSALGLFSGDRGPFFADETINFNNDPSIETDGMRGKIKWQKMENQFINIDFNNFFARKDPATNNNPEECCAEGCTYFEVESSGIAQIEVFGSPDLFEIFLNGDRVLEKTVLHPTRVDSRNCHLTKGWNQVFVRTCEGVGDWYLTIRIVDVDGKSVDIARQQGFRPDGFSLEKCQHEVVGLSQQMLPIHSEDQGVPMNPADVPSHSDQSELHICWNEQVESICWKTNLELAEGRVGCRFPCAMTGSSWHAEIWMNGRAGVPFDYSGNLEERKWSVDNATVQFTPDPVNSNGRGFLSIDAPAEWASGCNKAELCVVMIDCSSDGCFHLFPDVAL